MIHTVKLSPKTERAKHELHEAGQPTHWTVMQTAELVAFSDREGPWIFCLPDGPDNKRYARWVHVTDDKLFNVEVIR